MLTNSLLVGCRGAVAQTASTTAYNGLIWGGMGGQNNLTESIVQARYRAPTLLYRLAVYVQANTTTTGSTCRTRINSANGHQALTIASGTSGSFAASSNEDFDQLFPDDQFCWAMEAGATGTINSVTCLVQSQSRAFPLGSMSTTTTTLVSVTRYFNITHFQADFDAAEAITQIRWQTAGTLSHFTLIVTANTRTDFTTYRLRINGANGDAEIAVANGSTGTITDISSSDAIVPGNLVNCSLTHGSGSGSISIRQHFLWTPSTPQLEWVASRSCAEGVVAGTTAYYNLSGLGQTFATELDAYTYVTANSLSWRLSRLLVGIYTNTDPVASSCTVRTASAVLALSDTALSLSIPGSTTGFFSDTYDTVTIPDGNDAHMRLVTGVGSGAVDWVHTSVVAQVVVPERLMGQVSL